jgi:hypothetical protein
MTGCGRRIPVAAFPQQLIKTSRRGMCAGAMSRSGRFPKACTRGYCSKNRGPEKCFRYTLAKDVEGLPESSWLPQSGRLRERGGEGAGAVARIASKGDGPKGSISSGRVLKPHLLGGTFRVCELLLCPEQLKQGLRGLKGVAGLEIRSQLQRGGFRGQCF